MQLRDFFAEHPRVALAFSGGVDSAYLLYEALHCGAKVQPYFVKTAFQPEFEGDDARRLCEELHVPLCVIPVDILACDTVVGNPSDRCYYCKRILLDAILQRAALDGYDTLIDGTNASDDSNDRPGMRALAQCRVLSPLRLCGLDKAQIRHNSRKAGLFTHDKPAYACLATRIPCGTRITAAALQRIECAENALSALGFRDFRVRMFADAARLQLPASQFQSAIAMRQEILHVLKPYFPIVLLDLEDR